LITAISRSRNCTRENVEEIEKNYCVENNSISPVLRLEEFVVKIYRKHDSFVQQGEKICAISM
jgi:hypothetical protein